MLVAWALFVLVHQNLSLMNRHSPQYGWKDRSRAHSNHATNTLFIANIARINDASNRHHTQQQLLRYAIIEMDVGH